MLTPGPIRAGTRLREHRVMFGAEAMHELEIVTIDRPHRLRLQVDHPDLHYELDHVIDAVYGGSCRLMLIFRSRPATAQGQVLQRLMADELERDLADFAAAINRHVAV